MAVFVAFGALASLTKGLPSRFGSELAWIAQQHERFPCVRWPSDAASEAESLCLIGAKAAEAPNFMVWGDSHAEAFAPAFERAAQLRKRAGFLSTQLGCPPIVGVTKEERKATAAENASCTTHNDFVLDLLKAHSEISSVFLVARWPYYKFGSGYGYDHFVEVEVRDKSGKRLTGKDIEAQIERTVQALLDLGKEVYLVEAVPEFPLNVPDALARTLLLRRSPAILDHPRAEVKAREVALSGIGSRFQTESRFHLVATHDLFCDGEVCRGYNESGPLYFDNNHIGLGAASLVAQRVEPLLR